MLAGVAGGLAAHLGINPWWIRWSFILLSIFGGSGVLLYIAAWLLIPDANEEDTAVSRWLSTVDLSDAGSVFGIVLIGAGAVILSSQVLHISGAFVAAAIFFAVGVMLYRGDLRSPPKAPAPPVPPDEAQGVSDDPAAVEPPTREADGAASPVSGEEASVEPIQTAGTSVAVIEPAAPQTKPPRPPRPPKPPRERSMLGRFTMAIGLIVISTMALVDISGISFGTVDFGDVFEPVHYAVAAIVVVAGGLLVGAFVGRARWLIFVGILLLPVLLATSLWSAAFEWSTGERLYSPTNVLEVDSPYELGAGQLTIDLTNLSADELAEVGHIKAKLGVGELLIFVPTGVGVVLDARVGLGDIDVPGPDEEGIGPSMSRQFGPSPVVLFIDAQVGAGLVKLTVVEILSVEESVGSSS